MSELRAQERALLLAHVGEHVDGARHGLDEVVRVTEEGTGEDATVTDSGLAILGQLSETRDAAGQAVHDLAVELIRRGARAKDVAAAARTTSNTVHRWKREALS